MHKCIQKSPHTILIIQTIKFIGFVSLFHRSCATIFIPRCAGERRTGSNRTDETKINKFDLRTIGDIFFKSYCLLLVTSYFFISCAWGDGRALSRPKKSTAPKRYPGSCSSLSDRQPLCVFVGWVCHVVAVNRFCWSVEPLDEPTAGWHTKEPATIIISVMSKGLF